MNAELAAARVRVPCSTSNLGAGFDCLGLALDRCLDAAFIPGGTALEVERSGTLAQLDVPVGSDTVVRAFRAGLDVMGAPAPRGTLRMSSRIPVSRGLGSSAAATAAGLALAAASGGTEFDRKAALVTATELEGHPDNAAPCLLGGLVGVAWAADGPRAFRLPLSDRIGFAWAAPPVEVRTDHARSVLPANVPHATASRALGRVAALVHGLALADRDLLRIGFADDLHVPYRLELVPGADSALDAGVSAGAWAVTVSGSGSGLIAVCEAGSEVKVADAMGNALRMAVPDREEEGVLAFPVRPDTTGLQIMET